MNAREIAMWRHLDGIADTVDRAELSRALAEDPAFCAEYLAICRLHAELREQRIADHPPSGAHLIMGSCTVPVAPPVPARRWRSMAVAALVLLAVGLGWWHWNGRAPAADSTIVADTTGIGHVRAGDRLQADAQAITIMTRAQGARLQLAVGGELMADTPWHLLTGDLDVEVPPQPTDQPLVIQTPHAQIEVLGTAFRLQVSQQSTHLVVTTGAVRMRTANEERICRAGEDLLATPGQPLIGGPLPPPGTVIASFTFEDEVPPRWDNVTRVSAGPSRDGFGVAAGPHSGAGNQVLAARWEDWRNGLFAYDDRLVLTAWVWIEPTDVPWADVWVGHADGTARHWALDAAPRGRWWRIVVPLAELTLLHGAAPTRQTQPGEQIAGVFFQVFHVPGARLLVDDVQLIRR